MYVYPFESVHVYRGGSHLTVTANRAGFYIYLETSTAKIHWQVPAFPLALFNVLRESLQRTYSEDVTKNVEPFVCGGIPQNVTGSLELLDDGFALLTLTELFGQTAKIKLRKTEVGKFAEALRNFFTC